MMLRLENISFQYPRAATPVLKGVTFALNGDGFHAIFGPSGVGKTSLARILSRELSGFSGTFHVEDNRAILYSYNQERLPGWATIGHFINTTTPEAMTGLKNDLIDIFGLKECLNLKFSQLSLGQKNRANLIRYLLQRFDLLIMDESLANVDERLRETIILTIKSRFPNRSFLYISHNLMEIVRFSDSILVFRDMNKTPQAVSMKGMNLFFPTMPCDQKPLETALLEIMNAC